MSRELLETGTFSVFVFVRWSEEAIRKALARPRKGDSDQLRHGSEASGVYCRGPGNPKRKSRLRQRSGQGEADCRRERTWNPGLGRATGQKPESEVLLGRGRSLARRKLSIVVDIVRREDLASISRKSGVTAATICCRRGATLTVVETSMGGCRRRGKEATETGSRGVDGEQQTLQREGPANGRRPPLAIPDVKAARARNSRFPRTDPTVSPPGPEAGIAPR